jgi:hypothetical protein
MNGDSEIRVQLARIEGKQDVTNERLSSVQNDIVDIRRVQRDHGGRINVLETDKSMRTGALQGLAVSGRIIWAGIGSIVGGGGIVALLKFFGA